MDPAEIATALAERAREEGFDAIGIAEAARLERDGNSLAEWIGSGRHAGMRWLARDPDTRADPRRLLPGCRSVIVVAMNYWPGEHETRTPEGRARVALYARGRDYHKVLGRKLKRLAGWLESVSGAAARPSVDTSPVLERAWAERTGIGWIGKNANLLISSLGSWLLLGEILSCARIAPVGSPHEERCGSCTECIAACPTGAIVAPGIVDSRLCIAYWTIEHRGTIPEPMRESIGDRIFGCDDCQVSCPWNRTFARPTPPGRFGRREDLRGLDPETLVEMDEREFRRRFEGTSLMRARWDGLRRNACIVLANRGDPAASEVLQRAADDPDPVVREHARWGLRRFRPREGGGPS